MTTPTTAECIEWLDSQIKYVAYRDTQLMRTLETIRAQLLAAQEMAKALQSHSVGIDKGDDEAIHKALTAWRKAGGQ